MRRTPSTLSRPAAALAAAASIAPFAVAQTEPIVATFDEPSADRWNYPFNPTPGSRWTASTFGNEPGSPLFDNRDGQFTLAFDTSTQIPAGTVEYEVISVRLEIENASDASWRFDPTPDPWQSYLPEDDPLWVPDLDAGEPIELFGTGYRNGVDVDSWQESTPFGVGDPLAPSIRSAYAIEFAGGVPIDVSNSVREQFDPQPWALGLATDVEPGDLVPYGSTIVFDVDLAREGVADYFESAFARGRVVLSVTSLAKVVQQGASFPGFHCKESPLVEVGVASAAKLEVVVRPIVPPPSPDLDGDGSVGGADLTILLSTWGTGKLADLDGDGVVGGSDLTILLAAWE